MLFMQVRVLNWERGDSSYFVQPNLLHRIIRWMRIKEKGSTM